MQKGSNPVQKTMANLEQGWLRGLKKARISLMAMSKRLPWNRTLTPKGIYYVAAMVMAVVTVISIFYLTWGVLPGQREQNNLQLDGLAGLSLPPVGETLTPEPRQQQSSRVPTAPLAQEAGTEMAVTGRTQNPIEATEVAELPPLPETIFRPLPGEIVTPFGWRQHPLLGDWRFHVGVDLAGQEGQSFGVALSGTIAEVYSDPFLGTVVAVDHGGGWQTRYGRVQHVRGEPGQWVAGGEILGEIVVENRASNPFLNFELRYNGQALDPGEYLPQTAGTQ